MSAAHWLMFEELFSFFVQFKIRDQRHVMLLRSSISCCYAWKSMKTNKNIKSPSTGIMQLWPRTLQRCFMPRDWWIAVWYFFAWLAGYFYIYFYQQNSKTAKQQRTSFLIIVLRQKMQVPDSLQLVRQPLQCRLKLNGFDRCARY